MFKPNLIARAVALGLLVPAVAQAELEISGEVKNETAFFTSDGLVTGQAKNTTETDANGHKSGDVFKSETSLKLFINSDVGEESSFHAELFLVGDSEAEDGRLDGHENYSQYDYLREFYFDTTLGDIDFRLGKQQVVWGTADGIKLLDIINPTDFREFNQNTTEDARIPVWMINGEKYFDDGSSFQGILSQAKPNFIAGLDADGDSGSPFIFKGVDTITGRVNGFNKIAPNLGATAGVFQQFSSGAPILGLFLHNLNPVTAANTDPFGTGQDTSTVATLADAIAFYNTLNTNFGGAFGTDGNGDGIPDGLQPTSLAGAGGGSFTVQNFIDGMSPFCAGGSPALADQMAQAFFGAPAGSLGTTCAEMLNNIAQGFAQNNNLTRLVSTTFNANSPDEAFEFMNQATFATFDTFAGVTSEYRQDYSEELNLGFRFRGYTDGGTNYSLNYLYNYDPNPVVSIHWEDNAGNTLTAKEVTTPGKQNPADPMGTAVNPDPIYGEYGEGKAISLFNADGSSYNSATGGPAKLVFVETMERTNNIGGSFDTAVDGLALPLIVRGEFLYTMDARVPVIDRNKLAVGDLVGALQPVKTDFFKYVLGADVTVLTNLLVSTQLIQMYNLDFIDNNTDASGAACTTANCGVYTGDPSTLHISNGLKKGDEVETFISVFLSKPFGPEGQHRWNNITIAENGGGYWNRFDVEYSFDDNLIGTTEWNHYWGDENTTFGQFANSSNLQVGLKYLFQ